MRKIVLLKTVNALIALLLVNQIVTGLLNETLPHRVFEVMHPGGGIVFAAAIVLHVILNWNWIKANWLRKASTAG
jgi:hypothetical protein